MIIPSCFVWRFLQPWGCFPNGGGKFYFDSRNNNWYIWRGCEMRHTVVWEGKGGWMAQRRLFCLTCPTFWKLIQAMWAEVISYKNCSVTQAFKQQLMYISARSLQASAAAKVSCLHYISQMLFTFYKLHAHVYSWVLRNHAAVFNSQEYILKYMD